MDQHYVAVAILGVLQRLASADRHYAHIDPGLLGEDWQDMLEQAGVLGRGRRLDDNKLIIGLSDAWRCCA
jgi:hypothetical protein